MTTRSSSGSKLQYADRQAVSRRRALKLAGTTLAGGLTALLWPRNREHRAGSAGSSPAPMSAATGSSRPADTLYTEPSRQRAPGNSPNIIFILGDNHNAETMGCAGHPFIQTPGLDRLASEGLLFENTFNTTSLCSPSRASILTGAYAHHHGVRNNHTPWTGQMTTFLEYLSLGGYATAFIGKWHMPGEGLPEMPFLDLFVSYTYREGQGAYFNCPMIVNGQEVPSRKPYISEEITDYAIEFMQENLAQGEENRKPFCVYLSHRAGHPPFQSPEGIAGMYEDADVEGILPDQVDPWWYGKSNGNVFQGVMMGSYYNQYRRYCETLTAMDRDIVRLLEFVDQEGLRDNTVVIYMGDNGMQWGTHDCHGIREPYEESIKLPFIVRAPWLIADPGRRRQQMALNLDVAPTLLEVAGLPVPPDVDGESLIPFLQDAGLEGREHFLLEFWRYFPENTPSYRGVRTERYKYIEFERGREPWLFDLQQDPREQTNLYGTAAGEQIVPALMSMMEAYDS
jgi:N-acetylglucosamine-6-sulfatase